MLRYLNDGRPSPRASITKWSSNEDASEWTFTLRKGLKWSDGHPVTTADVLFWWNDMANYDDYLAETVAGRGEVGQGHDLQADGDRRPAPSR